MGPDLSIVTKASAPFCQTSARYDATLTGTPLGNEVALALQVYPNPATDALRLVLPGRATATAVRVTDVRGALRAVPYAAGVLDVSGLANGLYTLTVSDGQKVFHDKFVKR